MCRSPCKDVSGLKAEIKEPVSVHLIVSETGGGGRLDIQHGGHSDSCR